jgi:hypothetical protein
MNNEEASKMGYEIAQASIARDLLEFTYNLMESRNQNRHRLFSGCWKDAHASQPSSNRDAYEEGILSAIDDAEHRLIDKKDLALLKLYQDSGVDLECIIKHERIEAEKMAISELLDLQGLAYGLSDDELTIGNASRLINNERTEITGSDTDIMETLHTRAQKVVDDWVRTRTMDRDVLQAKIRSELLTVAHIAQMQVRENIAKKFRFMIFSE